MTGNAVSVYDGNAADEFPVLKAFQQYIDAEQAKARKRMTLLCLFFSFIMMVVVAVFVVLLIVSSSRSQALNDRLIEYAMKERAASAAVQQPVQVRDDAALRALTDKLENLQESIKDERERSRRAVEEQKPAEPKASAQSLEIERLKLLLASEKEKAAADREKLRQAEIEEYRRRNYPEYYEKKQAPLPVRETRQKRRQLEEEAIDEEIDDIVNGFEAIEYFDEDDEADEERPKVKKTKRTAPAKKPVKQTKTKSPSAKATDDSPSRAAETTYETVSGADDDSFVIPRD